VIVGNAITGDSRVQKSALSAAHAGWDVLLVGRSPSGRLEKTWLGPVKVVRVPVLTDIKDREARRRRRTPRSRLTQAGLPTRQAATLMRAEHNSRARRRGELIGRFSMGASPVLQVPRLALKIWRRLLEEGFSVRSRAFDWEERHRRDPAEPVGRWRRDYPQILDLDLALGPVIEDFRPDVIHANDITMIHVAATAAGRLRAAGHRVKWLYDAHEYVAGVDWPTKRSMSGLPQVEREYIRRADAVVTVSPQIAALIQRDHDLPTQPLVVRNVPARAAIGTSRESVRKAAGLDPGVPLIVYSGYIHHERSIGTAVAALPLLPECHLVIVSGATNPELRKILELAEELEVTDRVHVVPYVAQHEVADYLSSADLGVILSKRTINYEMSLPTKFAEYLHAGLPVVVSDVKTLSAYVREHGVGEVFAAGDPESFRDAVLAALPRIQAMRANITDEVLDELSWERQLQVLLPLYAALGGQKPTPLPEGTERSWDVRERPRGSLKTDALEGEGPPRHWRTLGPTPIRLGLGPANYAGQLAAIAQAVTDARTDVSAEVFMTIYKTDFGFPADVYVSGRALRTLDGQLDRVRRILPRYTHLLADAFHPVMGGLNGDSIAGDLAMLENAKISVALLAHGSDARHPLHHMERVRHSLFHDVPTPEILHKRLATAERNRRIADESGLPVFVTTPDLLDDLPQAAWLPLVVDVDGWATDRPTMERPRPIVLHAPSNRWAKGTDRFVGQLEDLQARGAIDLRLAEGVPWRQMRNWVQDADIVVDQVAIGSYGTFACEAMAAGKPVVAYLTEQVEQVLDHCPIVNCEPESVGAAIEKLLDDRESAAQRGRESIAYVRRVHDGRLTTKLLSGFLRV
jgi:glycosyltransferase involved in cell wall biosynthesis